MQKYLRLGKIVGKPSDDAGFIEREADRIRSGLFAYDKTLLDRGGGTLTVDRLSGVHDGRFAVEYRNIRFECFFKRNIESDALYVVFSGSRPKGTDMPVFKRWSYYSCIDGSMLNIDDPMYVKYKNLNLGWYYGTEEECYCDDICLIVKEFAEQNGFGKIVFFASSGGGFAALYCACRIQGSYAMVINAQIKPSLYKPDADRFEKVCGIDLKKEDRFFRNDLAELIKQNNESRFLIVTNSASKEDAVQLDHLCGVLDTEAGYGLTRLKENVLSWVYEAKHSAPHIAQEYPAMFFALEYLLNHFDSAEQLEDIYLMFSEMWFTHYKLFNEAKKAKNDYKQRVDLLQYDTAGNISGCHSEMIAEGELIVPMQGHPAASGVLYDKLSPETIYELQIEGISALIGKELEFIVFMENTGTGTIYFSRNVPVGMRTTIRFRTGMEAREVRLKVSCGGAGGPVNAGRYTLRKWREEVISYE